jgi:hypothetical protein
VQRVTNIYPLTLYCKAKEITVPNKGQNGTNLVQAIGTTRVVAIAGELITSVSARAAYRFKKAARRLSIAVAALTLTRSGALGAAYTHFILRGGGTFQQLTGHYA